MSQLSSGAAQRRLPPLRPLPLELNLFFLPLVMSAPRKRKERTSDSQTFDSVQGKLYTFYIERLSHLSFAPLGNNTVHHTPAKDLILRIKAKLNHRADSQGAHAALVTELYELSTLSERLISLRSNSSEPLLDHRQSDVLDREGLSLLSQSHLSLDFLTHHPIFPE